MASLESVANFASIVGLVVSVIGFVYTIVQVKRSESAALEAARAAEEARDGLVRVDALTDFSAALTSVEEIQRLHRAGAWATAQDRYSAARHKLVAVRSSIGSLSPEQQSVLQGAIQQLSEMERGVGRDLSNGRTPEAAKLNALLSREADALVDLLAKLRLIMGR